MRLLYYKDQGDDVRELQIMLKKYNFYNGKISGIFDKDTLNSVKSFQKYVKINPDGIVNLLTIHKINNFEIETNILDIPYNISYSNIHLKIYDKIIDDDYYHNESTDKKIIFLNSTISTYRPDIYLDTKIKRYKKDKFGRPLLDRSGNLTELKNCYTYIIGGYSSDDILWDGKIIRAYDDKYWSDFLDDELLSKKSISINICNLGPIFKIDNLYYNSNGILVPEYEVIDLKYDGYLYWHKYTDKQLKSLDSLLKLLTTKWNIKITDINRIFKYDRKLNIEKGIYSYNNISPNHMNISPQPNIIKILNNFV